ncbi:malonyl-ACP O-methyltransferase BioC [Thermoactinomyces sp. DSM 45892]|uniref:malonyl-ACP O-methyltransferase BioC n=1 Tax=Thermoactinomyces sp. DSM 45892 TaxID=1882753 RepID=UPI00089CC63B|nr:malonyl-ACP O-methyltransferase BioC [Thermoactinomyces sp. DSM 45892]SDY79899.1 malonyl-CoA O-methyltransferase [Thermoactinomyces sp. DSM 45892]
MESIRKAKVAHRFNRSVLTYDQQARVQKQMAHHLIKLLSYRRNPVERICEIGCGTGYLTGLLIDRYPHAEIVAIDLASKMIEVAKEKVKSPHVQFIVGDAEALQQLVSGPFDLIISNATIQWLTDPKSTVYSWAEALQPTGWLVSSTFGQDTFQELATIFQKIESELLIRSSQHRLTMHSLEKWQEVWKQAGLTMLKGIEDWKRMSYSSCRDFFQSIKATGANYSETTPSLSVHRKLLPRVMDQYDQIYQMESGVYATYHLLYLVGQKDRRL